MLMVSPCQQTKSVISLMQDIMRNLPGSLGHGEFISVMLYVPERTYIFLNPKWFKTSIVKVMNIQGLG